MSVDFCPGYGDEPFATLVRDCPGLDVYPFDSFRTEWGPIFHRGRLDGTARLLAIGQDPGQHEEILRRILVGTAGKRVQGFTHKLGLTSGYVLVNTFLYSVFGQWAGAAHIDDAGITDYRNRWIAALLDSSPIEAVVAFGGLADKAWQKWLASPAAQGRPALAFQHVPHPTSPESANKTAAARAAATKAMLQAYNAAVTALRPAITQPELTPLPPLYGEAFTPADLPEIPNIDLPAGVPAWMAGERSWAVRQGDTVLAKRRTLVVTVPTGVIPAS